MKTIKCYICKCGEDFYEDDTECINCGTQVDQSKFVEEEIIEIVAERGVKVLPPNKLHNSDKR